MFDVSYDGKFFSDFGIDKALLKNAYEAPQINVETVHVDGMTGDLHFYKGDFQNITQTYKCIIDEENFTEAYTTFKEWLYSKQGYKKLENDMFPDEYRLAAVVSQPEFNSGKRNQFLVSFSCKPQRYLKIGDKEIEFTASGSIYNPTFCEALPLIRVYGTGDLKIADETVTVLKNPDYIDIDCALMDAYHESDNRNSDIKLSSGDFFHLHPKNNGVVLASGMRIVLTPRWFRL